MDAERRPVRSRSGEKPMDGWFRSRACSSSKIAFASLLMCAPLLLAQTTVQVEPNKDLPDAPMPVTAAPPAPSNLNVTRGTLAPRFDANRAQPGPWMGMSPAIGRPAFNTNALASEKSRLDGKGVKVAGRSAASRFSFDPIGGHANRTATHGGTQWYTSHIPWAGPIVRQGLKISKAHPHLTTVIKTIKPRL